MTTPHDDSSSEMTPFRAFLAAQLAKMVVEHRDPNAFAQAANDMLMEIAYNTGGYIGAGRGDYEAMLELFMQTMRRGLESMQRFRASIGEPMQSH